MGDGTPIKLVGRGGARGIRCDNHAARIEYVRLLILQGVPRIRHNDVFVLDDRGGVHRRALAVAHLAGDDGQTAIANLRGAGNGAGGEQQQLIARLHVHRIVEQRARPQIFDIGEIILVAAKLRATHVIIILRLGALVGDDHREHLILTRRKQRIHRHRRRHTDVVDVADELVKPREHLSAGHIVTVDDERRVGIVDRIELRAHIKKQRAVLIFIAVKIRGEVLIVVARIHDRVFNVQEIPIAARVKREPSAGLVVTVVQGLEGELHLLRISCVLNNTDDLGVILLLKVAVHPLCEGGQPPHVVEDIGQRARNHHQREPEDGFAHDLRLAVAGQRHIPAQRVPEHEQGIATLCGSFVDLVVSLVRIARQDEMTVIVKLILLVLILLFVGGEHQRRQLKADVLLVFLINDEGAPLTGCKRRRGGWLRCGRGLLLDRRCHLGRRLLSYGLLGHRLFRLDNGLLCRGSGRRCRFLDRRGRSFYSLRRLNGSRRGRLQPLCGLIFCQQIKQIAHFLLLTADAVVGDALLVFCHIVHSLG